MTSRSTSRGTRARMASVACCSHSPASGPSPYARVAYAADHLDLHVVGDHGGDTLAHFAGPRQVTRTSILRSTGRRSSTRRAAGMEKTFINPPELYKHPSYTRVITVKGPCKFIYLSGQTPSDENYEPPCARRAVRKIRKTRRSARCSASIASHTPIF